MPNDYDILDDSRRAVEMVQFGNLGVALARVASIAFYALVFWA